MPPAIEVEENFDSTPPPETLEPLSESSSVYEDVRAMAEKMRGKGEESEEKSSKSTKSELKGDRTRDSNGKFIKADFPKELKTISTSTGQPEKGDKTVTPPPVISPQEEIKPPQAWKATVREQWVNLPDEVRQEVARRERETAVAIQEAAEVRKSWGAFKQVVSPFEGMIQAEGSDPIRAVGALLQTAAALRTAPPAHKAHLVAQLVKNHGIPIDLLDQALAGQTPPPQQGHQNWTQNPQEFRDPRFDQFIAERNRAIQESNQREADEFAAKHEFFEDVRQDMADYFELATRKGKSISLEEAYNRAVKDHPEISKVMTQREAATKAAEAKVSAQRRQIAASSVRGQPAPITSKQAGTGSMLDDLIAARDELAGR